MARAPAEVYRLIERLHASETMAVVAVAGAGSQAISQLLAVAGASRTVLEVRFLYAPGSLTDFLGYEPRQFVGAETARALARCAYGRAARLRPNRAPVVGVACTATIATDRPKRGGHRCHVASWGQTGATTYSLEMTKGLRDRAGEEVVVSNLILRALVEHSGIDVDVPLDLDDAECLNTDRVRYGDPISALLAGHVDAVLASTDGTMLADDKIRGGLLPGSFDPFHEGHEALIAAASEILKSEVSFELSVVNVDKAPLREEEVRARIAQMAGRWPVAVSRAPGFADKARLFPGCTFVIGWDTATRLFDPRYYGGDDLLMLRAIDEIRRLGCRFLVAGRVANGAFQTLDDLRVPREFEDMFASIPESMFRMDLSSTELRLAGRKT